MDDDEECVDVGHAFLNLQELLLTGNDVNDQQIDSRCFGGVYYKWKVEFIIWNAIFDASELKHQDS